MAYLMGHLLGSTGGTILEIFGAFALGAYPAGCHVGLVGLAAMVVTDLKHALLLVPSVTSTVATPAIGRAYLAGRTDVVHVAFSSAMNVTFMLAILLAFVGNMLLGVDVWRSEALPKWPGAIWIASMRLFYALGDVLGQA